MSALVVLVAIITGALLANLAMRMGL